MYTKKLHTLDVHRAKGASFDIEFLVFKDKKLTLLLATDLLARGIDIDSLECVVNFDVPRDIETYTHRAGRTGRMGKEGYVITLVTHPEEIKKLKKFASVREIVLKNQELYIK